MQKICDRVEYGKHIIVRCKNHPDKRWCTKNSALGSVIQMDYVIATAECKCTIRALYHDHADCLPLTEVNV